MRIMLLSVKSLESKGGIATWTNQYLNECEKQELDVELVNTVAIGRIAKNATSKRNLFDEYKRYRRIANETRKLLNEKHFDIAHLNTSIGFFGVFRDYIIAKEIKKRGVPIVVHFHCDIDKWVTNNFIRLYLKKLLDLSSLNFVLCENSQNFLRREFNKKSVVIPNFVNKQFVVSRKKINEHVCNICFVGRVSKLKGALELIQVAESLPDIEFIFIGETTNELKDVKFPNNVRMVGTASHECVIRYLDETDLFILPSHTEGFSIALAESMARGVPSIATDVGANSQMLEGKGGIIVDVGDVEAIRNSIIQLDCKKKREEMSEWCINKVNNEYLSSIVMRKIKLLYSGEIK